MTRHRRWSAAAGLGAAAARCADATARSHKARPQSTASPAGLAGSSHLRPPPRPPRPIICAADAGGQSPCLRPSTGRFLTAAPRCYDQTPVRTPTASGIGTDMLRTRQQLEQFESQALAPYAMQSAHSRGRRFAQPEHPYRTAFQRDRDRIIHSAAFRRLEYKTQVFVNHEGDYYRTRLTHTLEAAQITRTVARAIGLNSELAEAVALAHDLGHTPFGHAGERFLNELMQPYGGFDHNAQSLRTVDWIEVPSP